MGSKARPLRRPAAPSAATSERERPLIVAMPKGRIMQQAIELFGRAGYPLDPLNGGSRKLVIDCGPLRVLVVRASDVPTYVEYGAADLGIAGRDVLDEQDWDLYEPLDLGIGACRMIVAEPAAQPIDERSQMHIRIASKYPNITRAYLQDRGITAEIIKLSGSVELGPLTGLADRIVDLTETGETLRQNGLVEVDTIMEVTSRLVVNPASLKLCSGPLGALIERLARTVATGARAGR